MALLGRAETTRGVVFSEGRTLCARVARPSVCRGIPTSGDAHAAGRWPRGHASIKRELSLRVWGARTSARWQAKVTEVLGASP